MIFRIILHRAIAVSLPILLVLAARLCLRRAPKGFTCALWGVVLLRLLCPAPISLARPTTLPAAAVTLAEVLPMAPAAVTPVQGAQAGPGLWEVLPWLWLAGALAMAGWGCLAYIRLRRRLLESAPLDGNVYLADAVASPFVLGLLRPRLYLPSDLSAQARPYVLAHERCHIRHGDPVAKALAWAALCLYWFHPLVWLAFAAAMEDMEMRCDEAALRALGAEARADYCASLLSLAGGRFPGVALAFGEGRTGSRIRRLARWRRPKKAAYVAAAALCLALTAACAVDMSPGEATAASPTAVADPAQADAVSVLSADAPRATVLCKLRRGESAVGSATVDIRSDGGCVVWNIAYERMAAELTIALTAEDGTLTRTASGVGGSINGDFSGLPAGRYHLSVTNDAGQEFDRQVHGVLVYWLSAETDGDITGVPENEE